MSDEAHEDADKRGGETPAQGSDSSATTDLEADFTEEELAPIRQQYRETVPKLFADIGTALLKQGDTPDDLAPLEQAYQIAHSMAGTAGTIGLTEVGDLTRSLSVALRSSLRARRSEKKDDRECDAEECLDAPPNARAVPREAPFGVASVTVIVLDDDPQFLTTICAMGRDNLVRVLPAHTGEEAFEMVRREPVDAAILDVCLRKGENAFEIARKLRSVEGRSDLPVAFISVDSSLDNRIAAAHAGGILFLDKPLSRDDFASAVRHLVPLDSERRPRLLVVDNDRKFLESIIEMLATEPYRIETLTDPTHILEVVAAVRPDLVLLDVLMPRVSGFQVCRVLRSTEQYRDLPVLFMTAHEEEETRVVCFRVGADDYIRKPVLKEELVARINNRLERVRLHRERADRDALTGIATRRAFIELLRMRLSEADRQSQPLSVSLIDLDHFKKVNDTYGHLAGDRVLSCFGRLLATRFRTTDLRGRWGGEEFAVAFYGEDMVTSQLILGRLQEELRSMDFAGDHGEHFRVSFSAGLAMYPDDGVTFEQLMRAADNRLYLAKRSGRDRIEIEGAAQE